MLASTAADGTLRIWSLAPDPQLIFEEKLGQLATNLSFSGSRWLAVGAADGTVR
jgi:WD40 repeat protein